jgi:hypothetical protein
MTGNSSVSTATDFIVGAAASGPPAFFNGETALANGVYYLAFLGDNYSATTAF